MISCIQNTKLVKLGVTSVYGEQLGVRCLAQNHFSESNHILPITNSVTCNYIVIGCYICHWCTRHCLRNVVDS